MTPEGEVQAHLKKRVLATGGTFRKLKWEGRKGATDTLLWWDGPVLVFVEVKRDIGRLSVIQEREIGRMRSAGIQVEIVYSKADVDRLFLSLTHLIGCVQ